MTNQDKELLGTLSPANAEMLNTILNLIILILKNQQAEKMQRAERSISHEYADKG